MRTIFTVLGLLLSLTNTQAQYSLKSPSEFLGYELGDRFTRHHQVVDYFKHLAEVVPHVQLYPYGETYEHRPLIVAVISSPENMARLEEIRSNNLKRAKIMPGEPTPDDIAIVWMSYNIHGNEASSIEAAMKTIHTLADPTHLASKEWLKNTVVIIDPAINPDGRDRYANFYNQYGASSYNPHVDALEHHEPWPGGRPNHYLFDLNRDWAWQSQIESQQRASIYHQWMPHVHVDFHEQYYNSPYYFAPAAEPFHEVITDWQREFQTAIGKNHAKYFDKEGWLYFTKEHFDLLYPSYGDTYPTYNGAIGMTYEQAGHGRAGLGVITEYGDTLTLQDRIAHHYTTGISTVEISAKNASRLASEFAKYFQNNVASPVAKYKTYVIKADNPDRIKALRAFLDKQRITYGNISAAGREVRGFSYQQNRSATIKTEKTDLIISAYQPKSRLLTALFEPNTKLSDTLTYDITAWAIPYVYGLDAYALTERLSLTSPYHETHALKKAAEEKAYAYVANYSSLEDARWLAHILKKGVNVRVAHKPLTINGAKFSRGAIVIPRRTNEKFGELFDELLLQSASQFGQQLIGVTTGFSDSGVDIGSGHVARVKTPKVALLGGDQTSSLNFGEIWHFFEQELNYPITLLGTDYFNQLDLSIYDVIIIPSGRYKLFDEDLLKNINDWVMAGGKLIVIGHGLNAFKDTKGYGLKVYHKEKEDEGKTPTVAEMLEPYEASERSRLSEEIFGAVFKIKLDNTHPLAYGYDKNYFSLKTNNLRFAYLESGTNVGLIQGKASPVSGFAGYKAIDKLEDSLVFGVEEKGTGTVIYMVDNPLFRAFWYNGHLLFANAIFLVGN